MAEMTGVPASTWEAIIARESNGQVNAANASGASGLFQTMPGWGSTATLMIKSRQHIMHTTHKVCQLGVIKKMIVGQKSGNSLEFDFVVPPPHS